MPLPQELAATGGAVVIGEGLEVGTVGMGAVLWFGTGLGLGIGDALGTDELSEHLPQACIQTGGCMKSALHLPHPACWEQVYPSV